jgi:predicted  nucleic acid-binding Zn ribbon protein
MVPSRDSLDERFANKYVREYLAKYLKITSSVPQITILGPDPDSAPACGCENPVDYILFTNLMTVESPIRCAECFHPVPLYLLPFTDDEEHLDALSWVSDYKACDTLQMHCTVGERFGEQQMLRHDSALSKSGRELCRKLEAKIQGKVYYFLHKYRGRSVAAERKRLCPECDRSWILADQWHGLFDFRCEHCRLLSNIASSLKQW